MIDFTDSKCDLATTMCDLSLFLNLAGYGEFCSSFNPLSPRYELWKQHVYAVQTPLRPLLDLFLFQETVDEDIIAPILGGLVHRLIDNRILERSESGLSFKKLSIISLAGYWLICQQNKLDPKIYFGDDSVALFLRLRPIRGGDCLDLCSGPGIQAIHCASFARHVTAVEINPIAAEVARLNILMNSKNNISIVNGSLYEPLGDQTFDTIVANPPLLPFPSGLPYPFVGHGGDDGMDVVWRILQSLPRHLRKNGVAQIIGTCLSDGILPLCLDDLEKWARQYNMNLIFTLISQQLLDVGSTYFEGLIYTSAKSNDLDQILVSQTYKNSLDSQGASHFCSYFMHIAHGRGNVRLIDLASDGRLGLCYVS